MKRDHRNLCTVQAPYRQIPYTSQPLEYINSSKNNRPTERTNEMHIKFFGWSQEKFWPGHARTIKIYSRFRIDATDMKNISDMEKWMAPFFLCWSRAENSQMQYASATAVAGAWAFCESSSIRRNSMAICLCAFWRPWTLSQIKWIATCTSCAEQNWQIHTHTHRHSRPNCIKIYSWKTKKNVSSQLKGFIIFLT